MSNRATIAGARYAASTPASDQLAAARLPIIQKIAERNVSAGAKVRSSRITALKKAPTTTPASNRMRVSRVRPARLAMRRTSPMANSAPASAAIGSDHVARRFQPRTTAPTAPTAAPPETPST